MAAVIVAIIHPAVNRGGFRSLKGYLTSQFVFYAPEEALLRRVVPAIAPAGHGLPQFTALNQLNELQTGVMDPLAVVDHSHLVHSDITWYFTNIPERSLLPREPFKT